MKSITCLNQLPKKFGTLFINTCAHAMYIKPLWYYLISSFMNTTLVSQIAEQGLISAQGGKIFEINKRTGFKKFMKNIT